MIFISLLVSSACADESSGGRLVRLEGGAAQESPAAAEPCPWRTSIDGLTVELTREGQLRAGELELDLGAAWGQIIRDEPVAGDRAWPAGHDRKLTFQVFRFDDEHSSRPFEMVYLRAIERVTPDTQTYRQALVLIRHDRLIPLLDEENVWPDSRKQLTIPGDGTVTYALDEPEICRRPDKDRRRRTIVLELNESATDLVERDQLVGSGRIACSELDP
jgi:hypothetical protein